MRLSHSLYWTTSIAFFLLAGQLTAHETQRPEGVNALDAPEATQTGCLPSAASLKKVVTDAWNTSHKPEAALAALDKVLGPPDLNAITVNSPEGLNFVLSSPASAHLRLSSGGAEQSDWVRVRELKAGAEITLTTVGSPPGKRYVLQAGTLELVVLNVTDPTLPAVAKDVLIEWASSHPDYLVGAWQGRTFRAAQVQLRLAPEGLFIADSKVADFDRVIQTVRRDDVAEVTAMRKHVGSHVKRGALFGSILGAVWGGFAAAATAPNSEYHNAGLAVFMGIVGAGMGAAVGAYVGAVVPASADVIYRARPLSEAPVSLPERADGQVRRRMELRY